MTKAFALLDNAREHRARYYTNFVRRDKLTANQIDQLDTLLERGFSEHLHCTIRIPYEFGRDLMALADTQVPLQLDWYQHCQHLDKAGITDFFDRHERATPNIDTGVLINKQLEKGTEHFQASVHKIQEHIRAGDVYQINHTDRLLADYSGDPIKHYRQLRTRQPAPYAALMYHPNDGHTLCLSPELFLQIKGQHLITEPMKGTAPCPRESSRVPAMIALSRDPKNRAENAMIVDLLRNDLSKISRPYGVKVTRPFHIAAHGSVLQMTSRIEADLCHGVGLADILRATFPCGSITGAPKRMAMQLIDKLEEHRPRGIYTGSIGYIEPYHGNYQLTLNIAIRTLVIRHQKATLGVGGGITIDSTPEEETQEVQTKAAFLNQVPDLKLIETLRRTPKRRQYHAEHIARLQQSAKALNIPLHIESLSHYENHHQQHHPVETAHRYRIELSAKSLTNIQSTQIDPLPKTNYCIIHNRTLPNHDPLRRYKTSRREPFDLAWRRAEHYGAFDALIFNQSGFLLEGGRSNIFLKIDGKWHTPSLDLDILPGIMRQKILTNPNLLKTKKIHESHLNANDLQHAEQIILCNSLRGIIPVNLIPTPINDD